MGLSDSGGLWRKDEIDAELFDVVSGFDARGVADK
jgi:hypothetical protein